MDMPTVIEVLQELVGFSVASSPPRSTWVRISSIWRTHPVKEAAAMAKLV
jgi:hypothetical protein